MPNVAFITDQHICRATRWEETLRVMDWCVRDCERLRPSAIALGGDLFDRKPDVDELRVVAEWLVRLANVAPVVGVAGNHDPISGMQVFNLLEARHPIFFADTPCVHVAGGVEFALLPWPRKGQLLAHIGEAGKEEARQVGVELLLNVLRGLGFRSVGDEPDGPRCFVGHVQLRGAKVSTGQPLAPGADFEIGLEDLGLAQCDAYLLGHIHLPADMQIDGAPACYGGSFRRTAYGEVEEKSLVVVDFDDAGGVAMSRTPIPCQRMVLIEDEWGEDADAGDDGDMGWLSGESPHDDEIQGADIRFRFRFASEHRDAAMTAAERDKQELLARGAADVKLDPQVMPKSAARAPEVARAKTMPDKLEAYWAAKDAVPPDDRKQRLLSKVAEVEEAAHAL